MRNSPEYVMISLKYRIGHREEQGIFISLKERVQTIVGR